MGKPITFSTSGWINTNLTIRAYVQDDQTGSNMAPSNVSAIAYTVTESTGPRPGTKFAFAQPLAPVGTYLSATLSTTGWTIDNVGYNFQATLPAVCFPDAGDYVIDIVGTLAADSSTFPLAKCFHHARSQS